MLSSKKKAVLRLADPLLKSLRPQILHEFVRIFVRLHIDHPAPETGFLQNADGPHGRVHPRAVAVVGQQHVFRIPPQQTGLPGRKGRAQRGHCLRESSLMHGDHIHVALTEDDIAFP